MGSRLKDKVALVLGAGSVGPGWGNGKATAVLYAREGARVVAVDVNRDAAEETRSIIDGEKGECTVLAADVSRADQMEALVAETVASHGRIDILHNNVGILRVGGAVDLAEDAWDLQFDVNVKGMFLALKYVLPLMEAQGAG